MNMFDVHVALFGCPVITLRFKHLVLERLQKELTSALLVVAMLVLPLSLLISGFVASICIPVHLVLFDDLLSDSVCVGLGTRANDFLTEYVHEGGL